MTDAPPIKTISSKVVYQNRWITVKEDKTIMPNGQGGMYGYVESKDSVVTAVPDNNGRVYMVRAFRYPSQSWGWELPGGGGEGEDPTIAALREVKEETGMVGRQCVKLGETLVCNGILTERMTTCCPYDLESQGQQEDDNEVFIDQKFFAFNEIDAMIENGEINDGQTITGLFFAQCWMHKTGIITS